VIGLTPPRAPVSEPVPSVAVSVSTATVAAVPIDVPSRSSWLAEPKPHSHGIVMRPRNWPV
jgi:hypothetical protein